MELLGILLILNSLVASFWWVTNQGTQKPAVLGLCALAVFAGCALILRDRITKLTIPGVGTVEAAAQQAQADASSIAELKTRVENQSATVDLVAQKTKETASLLDEVTEKNRRAEGKLAALDQSIAKANSTLATLESATEFTTTVVAAQTDDRRAFDRLWSWAVDKKHPFAQRALTAWTTIYESHSIPMEFGQPSPWREGFDPSRLSMQQLVEEYSSSPVPIRPGLIKYVASRNDIPELERLDFLLKVMEEDESLAAMEYAGRSFTTLTGQRIKAMALDYLRDWWKEHRKEFKGK